MLYSTFLGGSQGSQVARGIAIDSSGDAFVGGDTDAVDFPLVNSLQTPLTFPDNNGVQSFQRTVFVSELDPLGRNLVFSTIFGGIDGQDVASGIALDSSNNILASGQTSSREFPTLNAQQASIGAQKPDAFVFKISQAAPSNNPVPTVNTIKDALFSPAFSAIEVTGTNFVTNSAVQLFGVGGIVSTRFVNPGTLIATIPPGFSSLLVFGFDLSVMNPAPGGGASNTIHVILGVTSLTSLGMTTREVGGGSITLPLYGSKFAPGAVAQWNGQARATTFVSSTEVDAAIPASDLAVAGVAQVTLTDPGSKLTSKALPFAVTDFAIAGDSAQLAVTSGASAAAKISLTSQFGAFNRPVNLSCSGLPQFAQCSFAQSTLTPGSSTASTNLKISTGTAQVAASYAPPPVPGSGSPAALWLLLPGLIWMGTGKKGSRGKLRGITPKQTLKTFLSFGLLFAGMAMTLSGCGGANSFVAPPPIQTSSTPAGTYNITVTGTSASVAHAIQIKLVVR